MRLWDIRQAVLKGALEASAENVDIKFTSVKDYEKSHNVLTKAYKMHFLPHLNLIVAHFQGANGLFTFDIRNMGKVKDYFDFHHYPMTCYNIGDQ